MSRLTRLSTSTSPENDPLRSSSIEGVFKDPPEVGKRFVIYSDSLTTEDGVREVGTSKVVSVFNIPGGWMIKTLNSTYEIVV